MTGLGSSGVKVAAAVGAHTCAIVTGGGVKCWGANDRGQLGDGTLTQRLAPVDVIGLPGPAIDITGGQLHTCALLAGGSVWCWGWNAYGQLGDGTTTQRQAPVEVSALSGSATAVSAGPGHTCALISDGTVDCWGTNYPAQIGSSTLPLKVPGIAGGTTAISAGGLPSVQFYTAHATTCAIVSGITKCWGSTPTEVSGIAPGAQAVSYGGSTTTLLGTAHHRPHACVITAAGGARCWGSNSCGAIGDGQAVDCSPMTFPVLPATDVVGLSSGVIAISAGALRTCALMDDARVRCWGVGYGSTPVLQMEGTTPQSIFFRSGGAASVPINGIENVSVAPGVGAIVYASLTPGICSVTAGGTDASPFAVVTGLAAGTCRITAYAAGDAYFDPSPAVEYSLQVEPRYAQTIALGLTSALVSGGVAILNATSSSGLAVALTLDPGNGACTLSGSLVIGLGSGTCRITARQAGDAVYAPAQPVVLDIPVGMNAGTKALIVYRIGPGTVQLSSSPGLECSAFVCAGNFDASATVTLFASPGAGSRFDGWVGPCAGTESCTLSMANMSVGTWVAARFGSAIARLGNISTRSRVETGDNVLIGGFIIGGSAAKTVVVRARGPSMASQGVPGTLANPQLQLFSGQTQIASNRDWIQSPDQSALRASGQEPSSGMEAAIMMTLAPGPYTALVTGEFGNTGVGIVEVFEIDQPAAPLINISARGPVRSGDNVMIGGFIIQGDGAQTVVVRARGPSLAQAGVPGVLANPQLRLISGQADIAVNDNWGDAANAAAIQASGFAPESSQESAILMTLQPGAYTAIVSGVGNTTGIAIVEVFQVN